ncbi:MAG TPA: O-antigen ligase family protein [Aeromicrobium sp.]|nr:O-antigen ligase family protein [Aeromicrobium sp.]HKY59078.1 O-antigen ligase family protein [Aeromicrobium sp.]
MRSVAPRAAVWLVPVLLLVFVFGVLLRPAMSSPLIAIAAICVVLGIIITSVFGAERTSMGALVLAFGLAPLGSFTLGSRYFLVADAVLLVAFTLAIPRLLHRRLRLPAVFVTGALLFTAFGILTLAGTTVGGSAFVITAVFALVILPAMVVWMAPNDRQMFAMALAFGIGTAISTLIGLPRNEFRNSGYTYHPVALAYTAMLTLSFVPFLLASKSSIKWVATPVLAAIALVGVWTSGSRTGLVVLAGLLVLIPLLERSILLGLVVAAGGVLLLPRILTYDPTAGSTNALSRLFGTGGSRGSDDARLQGLNDALGQIQANPVFGNGYTVEHTYTIHNVYLQVLAAEGVFGFLGFVLMLAALVVPLRRATSPQRYLAYPAVAVILAGPFQPNMADHYLALTLGLSLMAAVGVMKHKPPPNQVPASHPQPGAAPVVPEARLSAW